MVQAAQPVTARLTLLECRDDLLPCRAYLRFCVLAAAKLGPDVHSNFLDTTFLVGRQLHPPVVLTAGTGASCP